MNDAKMEKAEDFAYEIVKLYPTLFFKRKEFIISKQLMRSSTSIGANIAESVYAESHADFMHKISIALKEANESKFWLKLLYRGGYINEAEYEPLQKMCSELVRILYSIRKQAVDK